MLRFISLSVLVVLATTSAALADELPSWNNSPVKDAILEYLAAVVNPDSEDFVPTNERVAVFDNDGTFICERPRYPSSLFQISLLKSLAAEGLVDGKEMPYKAWIDYDRKALDKFGWKKSWKIMNNTFAGMPVEAFKDSARVFMNHTLHEKYEVPLIKLYYVPMQELAILLKSHEFQLWVVTGSEQDFMRSYLEDATGVPPEKIIGSWTPAVSTQEGDEIIIVRGTDQVYNGHQAKPGNIETRIGRRPLFVVGNSDNDQPMCRYAITGKRRGFALWIHHDDPKREYKYDGGTEDMADLVKNNDNAWRMDMSKDWKIVFQDGVQP